MIGGLAAAGAGASVGVVATTFGFGFRHGFDWDHLSAIGDITQSGATRRRAIVLSTLYALGHAAVVFVLGVVAIALGSRLPAGIDAFMGRVVGATLIALGVYVLVGVARDGGEFRMQSRWMLVIRAGRRLARRRAKSAALTPDADGVVVVEHDHVHDPGQHHDHEDALSLAAPDTGPRGRSPFRGANLHRHPHRHVARLPEDPFADYGAVSATAIGMLHGIGAETPTQVLVLTTAAGVAGVTGGLLVLSSFLAGLFCANTFVAFASAFGLRRSRSSAVYAALSIFIAIGSIVVGTLFVLGRDNALPFLFG
jgi:high-affinity nickel-transport protein